MIKERSKTLPSVEFRSQDSKEKEKMSVKSAPGVITNNKVNNYKSLKKHLWVVLHETYI